MMYIALFTISGYLFTMLFLQMIKKMLIESGHTRHNYQGILIPNSMGISFILGTIITSTCLAVFNYIKPYIISQYVLTISIIGLIGVVDDFNDNDVSKGFKGHISNLVGGKLTTGGLKAIIGLIIACIISQLISNSFIDIVINTIIISLTTNLINLLDTKPLRAIKGYVIILILTGFIGSVLDLNYIIVGAIAAYLPIEIKEQGMMGDSGSNFIGALAGINLVINIESIFIRILLLIIVIILNLLSERYSFSKIIEKNSLLRLIDYFGRKNIG